MRSKPLIRINNYARVYTAVSELSSGFVDSNQLMTEVGSFTALYQVKRSILQTIPKAIFSPPGHDHLRPGYHFLPRANWMNDPNGLIQWHGTYHLFYQYNPHGPFWGTIHWGHASSRDLVNWQHHPIALTPGPEQYDRDGCWSGCAVDDEGIPTLLYTGKLQDQEMVCVARADARFTMLHKHPANPVIIQPPPGIDILGFRDPWVWRENGQWQLVLGSGIHGKGGAILRYASPDLVHWEYQQPLCVGDDSLGDMWECPNFFALGDRHVLVVSTLPQATVLAGIGTYHQGVFVPETWQRLDGGHAFYAPQLLRDHVEHHLCFAWIKEERDLSAQLAAGWAGVMSLPRTISLSEDMTLAIEPAAELAQLRMNERTIIRQFQQDERLTLPTNLHGQWEAEIVADTTADTLTLAMEEAGAVLTAIEVDLVRRVARLWDPEGGAQDWLPFTVPSGMPLRLRCFFDRSVLECFVQGQVSFTKRIYPQSQAMTRPTLTLTDVAGGLHVEARVWDMLSATFEETPTSHP